MRLRIFIGFAFLAAVASKSFGQEKFSGDILLIGVQSNDVPEEFQVRQMSRTGELGSMLYRSNSQSINSGRLDRSRQQLALGVSANDASQLWVVNPQGEGEYIADITLLSPAWSPDSTMISYTDGLKSYRYDFSSEETTNISFSSSYVIDDWHPTKNLQTTVFQNPRNKIYREFRGDRYPLRQIDYLSEDDTLKPLTKNPCTDNIWSRFSPDGTQIAHWQRIIRHEVPHETLVVCNEDGTHPKTLVDLRLISFVTKLPWYRPKGSPVWSPDGKTIAWLIDTNKLWTGNDELEILFIDVETKNYTRQSLSEKGITWVSQIDW